MTTKQLRFCFENNQYIEYQREDSNIMIEIIGENKNNNFDEDYFYKEFKFDQLYSYRKLKVISVNHILKLKNNFLNEYNYIKLKDNDSILRLISPLKLPYESSYIKGWIRHRYLMDELNYEFKKSLKI